MKRYFYICDDLQKLESVERELEESGISTSQIHVLSSNDSGLEKHHLNQVSSFLKTDVVHSALKGAIVGLFVSILCISIGYLNGLTDLFGWPLSIAVSLLLLGLFTWEGGFIGIQLPNSRFNRFESALNSGKHILLIDIEKAQKNILMTVVKRHNFLQWAGSGLSMPKVIIATDRLRRRLHHIEL